MRISRLRSVLLAAIAAATLSAAAAQAQPYYQPGPGPGWHHWHHGDRFYGPRHVVIHWRRHHLPPPPPGSVWVQEGPQFVLVGRDGFVLRVLVP